MFFSDIFHFVDIQGQHLKEGMEGIMDITDRLFQLVTEYRDNVRQVDLLTRCKWEFNIRWRIGPEICFN